jgi:hypothetical protein
MAIMEPNDEEKQEKLPNDYSTPFSPPSGIQDNKVDTHPAADANLDSTQQYNEGISGAAEISDPGSRGVLGYAPPTDDSK